MRHRPQSVFVPLVLLVCASEPRLQAPPDPATLQPAPEKVLPGFRSITPEICKEWLSVIASDEMGGRATGTPGYEKAARYVAAHFKEFGLKPVGDVEPYFQKVPFGEIVADPKESALVLQDDKGKELLRVPFGEGFGGFVNANADRVYDLVFVRSSAPEDLAKLDLEGKAVLLLANPGSGSPLVDRSQARGGAQQFRPPQRQTEGNPGIMIRIDDRQAKATAGRPRYLGPNRQEAMSAPRPNNYAITREKAEQMLAAAGIQAAELDAKEPGLVPSGSKLAVKVKTMEKPAFAVNVVGLLEGSDPKLKEEVIGIGSHLDHIGTTPQGIVNNGADDDGSGSTGVLAVARAMTLNPVKPRRSVLFMCFCAEELGLQGSLYYTMKPVFEHGKMVAELQMDMIGRHEENARETADQNVNTLKLIGTKKLSEELHELCLATNRSHIGFDYEFDAEDVFYRSDHVNFAMNDIPIAFFFTGFHPQYHQHDDEVGLIDFPKLARVAGLVYLVGFELADRATRIKVDRAFSEIPQEGGRRPRRAATRPASRPAGTTESQPAR